MITVTSSVILVDSKGSIKAPKGFLTATQKPWKLFGEPAFNDGNGAMGLSTAPAGLSKVFVHLRVVNVAYLFGRDRPEGYANIYSIGFCEEMAIG